MDNAKSPQNVTYMLRHLLTANITDPISTANRGYTNYTQYFSGTGASGQINYLERKPTTSGSVIVKVSGVQKTDGTDYTLDRSAMTITWTGTTPASSTDNISVEYQCYGGWVFDDHPALSTGTFPRITVDDSIGSEYETYGFGTYTAYNSGPGDFIRQRMKLIVRNRQSKEFYSYKSLHLKNMDLVNAISEEIVNYLQTHRQTTPWRFWDWRVIRTQRVRTEEDSGIFRKDIDLEVMYFDKST
jgi:hypothetical protein